MKFVPRTLIMVPPLLEPRAKKRKRRKLKILAIVAAVVVGLIIVSLLL